MLRFKRSLAAIGRRTTTRSAAIQSIGNRASTGLAESMERANWIDAYLYPTMPPNCHSASICFILPHSCSTLSVKAPLVALQFIMDRLKLLLSASLVCNAAAALNGDSTTTLQHTSTITIVQTIHTSSSAAAVAIAVKSTTTDEHSYADDAVFNSTVLSISNTVRQQYNASALLWNDTLAGYAQAWSEGCRFKHSVGLPSPLP